MDLPKSIIDMQAEVEVPANLLDSWQDIVNLLAEVADVPAALIMRVMHDSISVFRTSDSEGNPYPLGAAEKYYKKCGLYCEEVIRTNDKLLIPDALSDPDWKDNPDVPLGMISYLGFPIHFPDNTPFGTICVLDNKPNAYDQKVERIMIQFRDIIENHLTQLSQNIELIRAMQAFSPDKDSTARLARQDNSELQRNLVRLTKSLAATNSKLEQEIAERMAAEMELLKAKNYVSNIIDLMPSILIGVDRSATITHWNRQAEKVTGINRSAIVGQPLSSAFPRFQKELEYVQAAIDTGQTQLLGQRIHTLNGKNLIEEVAIFPLVAEGLEGAVLRIDDVTKRVRLEQMMVQSEKMMSIGGLAAGIAHEINNPLAAILGYVFNIKKRITGDIKKNKVVAEEYAVPLEKIQGYLTKREVIKMLDGIHESGERAATIVSNMLSFSRKSDKEFGSHSLPELLDKTIDLAVNEYNLTKQYDFRKIDIKREYDSDVPDVHCEANEIQQVLLNLLKNGAEAMAEKDYHGDTPRFTLRVRQEREAVVVEVEDNGPGIPEEIRKRVLEPFYTTKEAGKGTGLGLSVSYFILTDQHGGNLDVESVPGEWTRFTITLPIVHGNNSNVAQHNDPR